MSQAAPAPDFAPERQEHPPVASAWWAPVARLDWEEHSAHNIALTACGLGIALGAGACVGVWQGWTHAGVFGVYVAVVAAYHMLEYLGVALYNPERVELGSFMFNPDVGNGY
ncbi:farnesyl cysteine-carboxyl methyltransferase, partial [Coemansia helicoidea]